jgi:tetratricopeptide (TPR) repeat protein
LEVQAARNADIPLLVATSLLSYAGRLLQAGLYAEAEQPVAEALAITSEDALYGQIKARALILRAGCSLETGILDSAAPDLAEADRLLEPQGSIVFAAGVQSDLIRWWRIKAKLHSVQGQQEQSLACWEEALTRARQMAKLPHVDSVCGAKTVSTVLEGFAEASTQAGRDKQAEEMRTEAKRLLQQVGLPIERFNQK